MATSIPYFGLECSLPYLRDMRTLLIIVTLLSGVIHAQWEHPDLKLVPVNWEQLETEQWTNKQKLDFFKGIQPSPYVFNWKGKKFKKVLDNCHFLDINGDKSLDMVYLHKGNAKQQSFIAFYLSNGNTKGLVTKLNGELRAFYPLRGKRVGMRLTVMTNPYCDHSYYSMRELYFGGDLKFQPDSSGSNGNCAEFNNGKGVSLINEYIYLKNLYFPEAAGTVPVRTFNDTALIFQKPRPMDADQWDVDLAYFATQDSTENRLIGKIPPNTEVMGIGYEITDGIPYFLVIVKNEILSSTYLEGVPGMFVGWVSGKQVIGDSKRRVD